MTLPSHFWRFAINSSVAEASALKAATDELPVSPQLPQSSSFSNGNMTDSAGPGYYGNGHQNGGNYSSHQQQQPMPPPKDSQAGFARRPINLNSPPAAPSSGANGGSGSPNKGDSTKRQSWLSRKFSRKEK